MESLLFDDEATLYQSWGLAYIPPYLREDRGEIEAALKDELPRLLTVNDIKGEVHCHSNWSDGAHSIKEMARDGGYILAAVHNIQVEVPPANIVELFRAGRELGKYPLR